MQLQLAALSPEDMPLIASSPIRPGERLGPVLLVVDGRFLIGGFDGEHWHDSDFAIVYPSRWLLLTDSAS